MTDQIGYDEIEYEGDPINLDVKFTFKRVTVNDALEMDEWDVDKRLEFTARFLRCDGRYLARCIIGRDAVMRFENLPEAVRLLRLAPPNQIIAASKEVFSHMNGKDQ